MGGYALRAEISHCPAVKRLITSRALECSECVRQLAPSIQSVRPYSVRLSSRCSNCHMDLQLTHSLPARTSVSLLAETTESQIFS